MQQQGKDILFWIWLSRRFGAGSKLYPVLLERFGTPYDIYNADEEEIAALMPELTLRERRALCDKNLDEAYDIAGYCKRGGYSILCYDDARYPLSYRSLSDPPLLLYYRGTLPDFQNRLCIAMVGTRKMSEYGRRIAYKIAYELAAAGVIIVSGMALGVDSVASCAALAAGGQTVAIFGNGIDVAYPPEHAGFKKILEQRALVMSEFAPGSEPKGSNFPIRNRLISGLCQGTLVVEGAEGSGALITADRALSQGRDLYAVPANIGDPNASGVNRLIRDGARVVLCADDILKQYSLLYRHTTSAASSASLGKRSDYDGEMLTRMGVYSRTVGGHERVSAATLTPTQPSDEAKPEIKASKPAPKSQKSEPRATRPKAEAAPPKAVPCEADHSAEILQSLGERERAVFEAIPMDHPLAIDRLQSLGYSTGELLAALSLLEIRGLIQTLPGGLYCRA
ncbi:MAG: DNA-processing protein DprA [Clostridia bacterium]|nr:DNA-processing protein DprA [Clostridia bacterium]